MGKKAASKESLDDAIRGLGGNDEDMKLVADADFSGSDFEDASPRPKNDAHLADDVAKMWEALSGSKDERRAEQTPPKPESRPASKAPRAGTEADPLKSEEAPREKSKRAKAQKQPEEAASNGSAKNSAAKGTVDELRGKQAAAKGAKNADSDRKAQGRDSDKRGSDAKHAFAKESFTKKPVKQEQPVSKKTRAAWDAYLSNLRHPKQSTLVDPAKPWADAPGAAGEASPAPPAEFVEPLKTKAKELLDAEVQAFAKEKSSSREYTSSLEFLKSGTFSDQLGTLSILSTESPLHSVKFLDTLVAKCEIKNRESACRALEVTKDLLVSHVLPDRRLRYFKEQPLALDVDASSLICWAFEDYLKHLFFRLLRTMELLLADTVENIRLRTLNCIFGFFQHKPEQEANLLRLSLNKLGDPAGKVASRVKRLLMDVLQSHPGMKPVVATAMAELLGRAHDYRTRYYAVDTMSEFILSGRDPALANQLIYIYLSLFERLLNESKDSSDARVEKAVAAPGKSKISKRFRQKRGKKGGLQQATADPSEVDAQQHARLVAKLFTGLNRAFPFSNVDPKVFGKYTDTLYKMSHSPNVGTFIEALSFIFQLAKAATAAGASDGTNDRYYRALYDSILDTRLPHSAKLSKYMHLLLRSLVELRSDSDIACSNAFTKRALQVACNVSEIGAVAGLVHVASLAPNCSRLIERDDPADAEDVYDARKRDPRFAKAETSRAWELLLLQQHFHPTVALYSNNILANDVDRQTLDMPDIEQYTVNSFLSKWSYKKPKAKDSGRGGSIFQPLAGITDLTLGIRQQRKGDETPASMQDWKSRTASDIAPEERFLFEYFVQRPDRKPKASQSDAAQDALSDAESIDEDEINEAMSRSGPGDALGGADLDSADLSSGDGDSDDDLENELAEALLDEDDESSGGEDAVGESDFSEGEVPGLGAGDDNEDDDFAEFDGLEAGAADKAPDADQEGKKRKRKWSSMPTFLDADAFEEMHAKRDASKGLKKQR